MAAFRLMIPSEFLTASNGLKDRSVVGDGMSAEQRRRLRDAERKVGELTLDNDILCSPRKGGSRSRRQSGPGEHGAARAAGPRLSRAGRTSVDTLSLALVREVIATRRSAGEGYRKVRAGLRRGHGVHVSGKRVLRPMRVHGLLAPQRAHRR